MHSQVCAVAAQRDRAGALAAEEGGDVRGLLPERVGTADGRASADALLVGLLDAPRSQDT